MIKKSNISKLDYNYYINEIGVLNWLKSNDPQKIRFKDRIEYKIENKLHREDGPAIEHFDGIGDQYFIEGKKLTLEEYKNYRRTKLIDNIINEK